MPAVKFYAVRKGREPGIYVTWPDCKKQVDGYPNAEYRKFDLPSEAENYLAEPGLLKIEDLCLEDVLVAYTDGSYVNGCAGYGVVFVWEGEVVGTLNGCVEKPRSRNVTGELSAVVEAIKAAENKGVDEIVICHDLMGIQQWADGLWHCNKKETKDFVDFIDTQRKGGMAIGFGWLRGHMQNRFNEKADYLAGRGARTGERQETGFLMQDGPFVPCEY